MGKKIFVSYKYRDDNVQPIPSGKDGTARDYATVLDRLFTAEGGIYKGENEDEDLSHLSKEYIAQTLRERIHDSNVTVVLVSPNMKNTWDAEFNQWIPREISYALQEVVREGITSRTNAVIAVALPDRNGDYDYYIKTCRNHHPNCTTRTLNKDSLFNIMSENMCNINNPKIYDCPSCGSRIHKDEPSYILSVKWCDFIHNMDEYINRAICISENRECYKITKEVHDRQ